MKVNIELPEIDGFSYTGEYRFPDKGEYYEHEGSALESTYDMGCNRFILKKVQKWRKVNCLEDIGKKARFRDLHSKEWKEDYLYCVLDIKAVYRYRMSNASCYKYCQVLEDDNE